MCLADLSRGAPDQDWVNSVGEFERRDGRGMRGRVGLRRPGIQGRTIVAACPAP